jgi:hypothetical protein
LRGTFILAACFAPDRGQHKGNIMSKSSICAAALGAMMAVSAIMPAEAMPVPTQTVNRSTDVEQARVVVRYGYYRGHRGYRYARPGYRRYNGFWYPPVAFGPVIVVRPRGHWRWCGPRWNRYRCAWR